jgi:hypothetical protein
MRAEVLRLGCGRLRPKIHRVDRFSSGDDDFGTAIAFIGHAAWLPAKPGHACSDPGDRVAVEVMLRRGWRWSLVLSVGTMFARPSAAEPSAADRARVVELLRRGDEAARVKDWKGCVEARRAALEVEYTAQVGGDLGLCEEQAGRFAAAYTHLWRALEAAPADTSREPWKRYDAAIVRLRERVVLLIITTDPSDARVVVDGVPVGQGDGRTIAVEPGRHTVAGRLPGYEDTVVETDDLRAGGIPNIQITLRPKPAGGTVTPAKLPATSTAARRTAPAEAPGGFPCLPAASWRGVLVPAACVGAAVFAVSAVTALGFELHTAAMRSSLDAKGFKPYSCAPGRPEAGSADCTELDARARQRADAVNVMIGSGIVAASLALGAGLAIALEPKGPRVAAAASTTGGSIVVQGQW